MIKASSATIRWLTHPPAGVPRLLVGSHSLPPVSVSRDERGENPSGTTPGELFAGAFGSVFAWRLAQELAREGIQARELAVYVRFTAEIGARVDDGDPARFEIHCHVQARVPGGGAQRLQSLCETALRRSRRTFGMREDIAVRVDSTAIAAD